MRVTFGQSQLSTLRVFSVATLREEDKGEEEKKE